MKARFLAGAFALGAFGWASAEEVEFSRLRSQANWEAGQIEEAYYAGEAKRVDKELINHATVWTLQEARLSENAKVFIGVGGAYFFVYPRNLGRNPFSHSKRSGFGLTDLHGEFRLFTRDEENHLLLLKPGIFGYKYNENAKNLGEYMYRTWSYPTIITTGGLEYVNSAGVQLSGIAANTRLSGFNNDLLLTIQSDRPPVFSLCLTDIVSYNFGGVFKIGAGYMLDNFYNPDKDAVEPKPSQADLNQYVTLSNGEKMAMKEFTDLTAAGLIPAGVTPTDTAFYRLDGQKAMVMASLDLGRVFDTPVLGPEDLRFYFEAILMGVQNRPTFYEKAADRMAYMFGVNIPAFRLLDVLSLEVQYAPNPYPNSLQGPLGDGAAVPHMDVNDVFPNVRRVSDDDWKWTLYARRKVYEGFAISVQAASDHIKMLDVYSTPDYNGGDFLGKPSNWYWVVRLSYSI